MKHSKNLILLVLLIIQVGICNALLKKPKSYFPLTPSEKLTIELYRTQGRDDLEEKYYETLRHKQVLLFVNKVIKTIKEQRAHQIKILELLRHPLFSCALEDLSRCDITSKNYEQIYTILKTCSGYKVYLDDNQKSFLNILQMTLQNKLILKMISPPKISSQTKEIEKKLKTLYKINFETNSYQILE